VVHAAEGRTCRQRGAQLWEELALASVLQAILYFSDEQGIAIM
jgi:hypothetical protein